MSARIKPHKVRGRQLKEVREVDPRGADRGAPPDRRLSSAGCSARARSTSDFQAAFIVAQLDPLRAIPILRVPGSGREPELGPRQLHARRRVHAAMEALGGISSPAGSCVWHVVGLQRSVREWAIRQGWGGRAVRHEQAQGILVAALGVLAAQDQGPSRRADLETAAQVPSTASPAAFHSGKPSSSRLTVKPRARSAATASNESTQ
jgi:hypothetical protein